MKKKYLIILSIFIIYSCNDDKKDDKKIETANAIQSVLVSDSINTADEFLKDRNDIIKNALAQQKPIIVLQNINDNELKAQNIAIANSSFCANLFDSATKKPYRNEIFNVYQARPQEIKVGQNANNIYKVEMYNYALNLTTNAFVDIGQNIVVGINKIPQSAPDLPQHLKNLAIKIAIKNPEIIKALGYKPEEADALMASTKTALNNTKCERSLHLCVAPTFIKDDKALWAIVDLTDQKLVGYRWTNVGTTGQPERISERKLKFDKIMECYCKQINKIEKPFWKLNYVITTSDGMRISEVYFKNKLIINNAKVVDWHVSYSNTDGFGYSDAVGCPEYSQAAVVAESEPRVSDIINNGTVVGFAIEQTFRSQQWPQPCNYNYLQRYEFYNDGRFRPICASLGRGCGNNGTYRPVTRISFAGANNTINEWINSNWQPWKTEQWKLENESTSYTPEGYQYKLTDNKGSGFFIEPNRGQFGDGGRGDFAYLYVTKQHIDKDEGETDLVSIGPCCNTDYRQGPEKFIDSIPEPIQNTDIVIWYVAQMKNDDTKGHEYCWAESQLIDGVYKTKVYPCLSGPMFVPILK